MKAIFKNINKFKETDIVIINFFNDLDVLSKFILINPNIKFILIADQTLNQIVCERESNLIPRHIISNCSEQAISSS